MTSSSFWLVNENLSTVNGSFFDGEVNGSVVDGGGPPPPPPASVATIAVLSTLFFVIGLVGIVGNVLVIYVIVSDKVMRSKAINLFIMNLAMSDLIVMVVCIPEIVQFMLNDGWRLGLPLCCVIRFTQVFALYASVMTLVAICIERYIAILHPMHANIVCCRARIHLAIAVIWPSAMAMACPNLIFHFLENITPEFIVCHIKYPQPNDELFFKYTEFFVFYLVPLVLQITLYIRIGRCLFNTNSICRMETVKGKAKYSDAMKARRGVVKMLIAGVVMYFVCFSPHQVLLFYNTFVLPNDFIRTWEVLVFVNIMAYMSSASNPLLYSIFSQKFRKKFGDILGCSSDHGQDINKSMVGFNSSRYNTFRVRSFKTSDTEI